MEYNNGAVTVLVGVCFFGTHPFVFLGGGGGWDIYTTCIYFQQIYGAVGRVTMVFETITGSCFERCFFS